MVHNTVPEVCKWTFGPWRSAVLLVVVSWTTTFKCAGTHMDLGMPHCLQSSAPPPCCRRDQRAYITLLTFDSSCRSSSVSGTCLVFGTASRFCQCTQIFMLLASRNDQGFFGGKMCEQVAGVKAAGYISVVKVSH